MLQTSLRKEFASPESRRVWATAVVLTDVSEMLLAGRSSEKQWIAVVSFITIPADSYPSGNLCSFLCRQGRFSAVDSSPSCQRGRAVWGEPGVWGGSTSPLPREIQGLGMRRAGCQQDGRWRQFLFSSAVGLAPLLVKSV